VLKCVVVCCSVLQCVAGDCIVVLVWDSNTYRLHFFPASASETRHANKLFSDGVLRCGVGCVAVLCSEFQNPKKSSIER